MSKKSNPDRASSPEPTEPAPSAEQPTAQDGPRKTVAAKLRCLDHRGETVHTRWGHVSFDADGLAELEVPEDELPMLRAFKPYSWLADDHPSYAGTPEK